MQIMAPVVLLLPSMHVLLNFRRQKRRYFADVVAAMRVCHVGVSIGHGVFVVKPCFLVTNRAARANR